jgi:hypothetical protein
MNMVGYTKLFSSIITSTIWREPNEVRILWITMLAIADKNGEVAASIPGLGDMARLSIQDTEEALEVLKSIDGYSRSKEFDGRRIEDIDGGWRILNYLKYRNLLSADERREYFRVKKAEQRARQTMSLTVFDNPQCQHIAEAEADTKKSTSEEKEGMETIRLPKVNSDVLPTTDNAKRIATLFRRRLTTAWSEKEVKAYKKICPIEPEELSVLEGYYEAERAKGEEGIHRRDLLTFLNNFTGEVDRARQFEGSRKKKNGAGRSGEWSDERRSGADMDW